MERVYVGNIPFKATADELLEFFSAFGATEVKLQVQSDGKIAGYGFVSIPSEQVESCIAGMNGMEYLGRPLRVNYYRPEAS